MTGVCSLDIVPFVTLGLALFTIAFSFYVWREDEGLQSVAFCGYEKGANFAYKAFASNFSHLTYLHLSLNVLFLLDIGFNLEKRFGSFGFAFLYGISMFGVIALGCAFHELIYSECSVGASAVLFSIFAFWCYNCEGNLLLWGILSINPIFVPWVLLIMCQLFFWSSAFGMHICGIVFGIITYYIVPKYFWDTLKYDRGAYRELTTDNAIDKDYPSDNVHITFSGNKSFENKTHPHSLV